jgi:tetratricopeptide (TPR) repeat protein
LKKQYLIAAIGFAFVLVLFYFGKTTTETKPTPPMKPEASKQFNVQQFILQEKQKLSPELSKSITEIENSYAQTTDNSQKIIGFNTAANFWKDSAQNFKLFAFYNSEAAKLDNSEKNLTFAAQQFLTLLRDEHDEAMLAWESDEAIRLFQEAIKLNPNNEDLKIGLGSSYVFGKGRNGDPQETMKGILEGAGSSMSNVLKIQMTVAEPNKNIPALNEAYSEFFPENPPVRSYSGSKTSQMGRDGILCQVSCIAYVD